LDTPATWINAITPSAAALRVSDLTDKVISADVVRRYLRNGDVEGLKINREWLITEQGVDQMAERYGKKGDGNRADH